MTTRRNFLIGASTGLISTPAIVRTESLMRLRGIILPTERHYFGFDRLYVSSYLPKIVQLQSAGLSLHEVAAQFNRRGMRAMNGAAWDAQAVNVVVNRNKMICCHDLLLRAERSLRA